jgi:hypothetical protein
MLLLLAQGCSSTSPAIATPSAAPSSAAASCTTPLTVDQYDGFHIGVPDGWQLFTLNNTIVVSSDLTATEEAVVLPALMTSALTPTAFLTSALNILQTQLAASGGTLTYTATSSGAQMPAGSLVIQSSQASVVGQAHVEVLPYPTAHGASVIALIAAWAPAPQYATDQSLLANIGACYGPQPGTLYQVVRDHVFTYAIPVGWQVTNEGQDTIDIADGKGATANFDLTFAPPGSGVNSAQTLLTWAFDKVGVTIGKVLFSTQVPDQTLSSGAVRGEEYVGFDGTLKGGSAIHGFVNVVSTISPGSAGGVIRLGVAPIGEWNSVYGALVHIIGSIQHDITQDLQQWVHLNQQWQAFGQQVQGFDYALNGVDLVHDPTTGATFEAPYNAYNPSGPAGPGYYSPAGTKLQVQTP